MLIGPSMALACIVHPFQPQDTHTPPQHILDALKMTPRGEPRGQVPPPPWLIDLRQFSLCKIDNLILETDIWHDQQVIFTPCQLKMDFFQSLLNLLSFRCSLTSESC